MTLLDERKLSIVEMICIKMPTKFLKGSKLWMTSSKSYCLEKGKIMTILVIYFSYHLKIIIGILTNNDISLLQIEGLIL